LLYEMMTKVVPAASAARTIATMVTSSGVLIFAFCGGGGPYPGYETG
jgi:hypothetical protein